MQQSRHRRRGDRQWEMLAVRIELTNYYLAIQQSSNDSIGYGGDEPDPVQARPRLSV
jgi:hypothetical protein